MPKRIAWFMAVLWIAGGCVARAAFAAVSAQTETDEYTRYELLAPDTTSFTIRYEVTATTPGAKYNQLG